MAGIGYHYFLTIHSVSGLLSRVAGANAAAQHSAALRSGTVGARQILVAVFVDRHSYQSQQNAGPTGAALDWCMSGEHLFTPWVTRFLREYLRKERRLSRNTQNSYRETLALLLQFASKQAGVDVDGLSFADLGPGAVRAFLDHLEQERRCSVATRNHRLSVVHSLAQFLSIQSVQPQWCSEIQAIPFKKEPSARRNDVLEAEELQALLSAPNHRTRFGARDRALLLFLYNSGARAAEVARLKVCDLQLDPTPSVRVSGVEKQLRVCPLWPATVALLRPLIADRYSADPVFTCRNGKPMSRFGIYAAVVAAAKIAARRHSTIAGRRISPHTIRNTTRVHLIRAGVDASGIQAMLGSFSDEEETSYLGADMGKALASPDRRGFVGEP